MKISVLVLVCVVAVISRSIQLRIERGLAMNDTIPLLRLDSWFQVENSATYVSVLKSSSQASLDLKARALIKIVRRHHGRIEYLGECFQVVIPSNQFDSESCDFVLVTTWKSHHKMMAASFGFANFRADLNNQRGGWEVHQVQKMVNSGTSFTSILMAVGVHGVMPWVMRAASIVTGEKYTLEPMKPVEEDDEDQHAAKLQNFSKILLKDDKTSPEEEPAYVWNFMQTGTMSPEDEAKDRIYAQTFIKMLTYHDGGPMHIGPLQPADPVKDGSYAQLAAVYYPSRSFFSRICNSQWMYETSKNKRAGDDSYTVVTVPYKPPQR